MGLAHVIGPGEREWFRRCRRAWDFGSPNRQNLELRNRAPAVDLLAAVRQAMAVWYFPGMWEWPRVVVEPRALQAFDRAAGRLTAPEETEGLRATLERYFGWAQGVDAFTPVRVEADFEAGIPHPRAPGQDLVDGDGRPVRYHDRVQLLIVDGSDAYWVVEHRLAVDGWATGDELLLAERPVTAAWGWEQFYLGVEIAGTVHNELWVNDIDRSDESFRRTWIPRPRAEIGEVGKRLSTEAVEMIDPGVTVYPTPTPGHCGRCDYRAPCLALNEGRDVVAVLGGNYRHREPGRPEEGRLGGGTWSMNRGAAPPPQWRSPRMPPS